MGVVALPRRAQGPGRPPFTLTAWPLRRRPLWIGVQSITDAPRERPGSAGMERTVGACWPLAPAVPTPLATAPVHGRAAWRLPGLRESWSESPPGRPHLMPPSTSHPSNPGVSSPKEASTRRSPNLRGAPPSVHPPPPPPASPPQHPSRISFPSFPLPHPHLRSSSTTTRSRRSWSTAGVALLCWPNRRIRCRRRVSAKRLQYFSAVLSGR